MDRHKFVAFDLEITTEIPEGCEDWKMLRPLGISCAATLTSDGDLQLWHGGEMVEDGPYPERMMPSDCQGLADYLLVMQESGYHILTFNGLGFDFDVLAEEVQNQDYCTELQGLALGHIDIFWQMFSERGFGCGLAAIAEGMGLAGKSEGMSGALAPEMWAQGREQQDKVLEYVAQDVRVTKAVYEAILNRGQLSWITKRSTRAKYPWVPKQFDTDGGRDTARLATASEAAKFSLPNVAWMDEPWPRSKFIGWTEAPFKPPAPVIIGGGLAQPRTVADILDEVDDLPDPGPTGELADLVSTLALARADAEAYKLEAIRLEKKLTETETGHQYFDAKDHQSIARDAVRKAEAALREQAPGLLDGGQPLHPALTVKNFDVLDYDDILAVKHAADCGWLECLKLDRRKFEKRSKELLDFSVRLAGALSLNAGERYSIAAIIQMPFVTRRIEPRVQVKGNLSEWLPEELPAAQDDNALTQAELTVSEDPAAVTSAETGGQDAESDEIPF